MKRHLLLSLAATLIALPALARDFTYTYEGQTLTYTVLDEKAKTCETKAGGWHYDIESEGKNDYSWPGNYVSGDLVLPSVVFNGDNYYTLVQIGNCSFIDRVGLTSVSIPNSVTSINREAFDGCSGLKKAEFASIEHLC